MRSTPLLRSILSWGTALGGFLVLYGLVFRLAGLPYQSPWAWGFYLALPTAAFFAMRSLGRRGTTQPFAQFVAMGWLALLLGSAIYCSFVYGYNRFLDDSLLRDVRADQATALTTRDLDPASRARALERLEALTQPGPFSLTVFIQLAAVGLLACLAMALCKRWLIPRPSG